MRRRSGIVSRSSLDRLGRQVDALCADVRALEDDLDEDDHPGEERGSYGDYGGYIPSAGDVRRGRRRSGP